jgi:hypothetical protein
MNILLLLTSGSLIPLPLSISKSLPVPPTILGESRMFSSKSCFVILPAALATAPLPLIVLYATAPETKSLSAVTVSVILPVDGTWKEPPAHKHAPPSNLKITPPDLVFQPAPSPRCSTTAAHAIKNVPQLLLTEDGLTIIV